MRNKAQEIIEASGWFFPAVLLSGWLWPVMPLINFILEVVSWL